MLSFPSLTNSYSDPFLLSVPVSVRSSQIKSPSNKLKPNRPIPYFSPALPVKPQRISAVSRSVRTSQSRAMATRIAARYASRRLSTSGKILSEEEKASENVYIKKMEHEKLDKLARKGPNEAATVSYGAGLVTNVKPASGASSAEKVSTDKYRNYAVLAGSITALGAIVWYIKGTAKKPEVQD